MQAAYKKHRQLEDKFQAGLVEKYGSVVEQLAPVRVIGKNNMLFFVWFQFYRRAFIPLLVLNLYNFPVLQIILILSMQIFYMMFIMHIRVFKSPSEQKKQVTDEIVIIVTLYMLLLMTGTFVDDPEKKDQIGWSMIVLTLLNFVYNILPIICGMLLECKRKCQRKLFLAEKKEQDRRDKLAARAKAVEKPIQDFLDGKTTHGKEAQKEDSSE